MRASLVFVVCALFGGACGPSAEEVIAKRKEGALAKLAVYREAVHKAIANPVLTPPKLAAKLDLKDDPTVQLMHTEWVEDPIKHAESNVIFEINSFIDTRNWCWGSYPMSGETGKSATRSFDAFENIKLLVALETVIYSPGFADGNSFSPGSFSGRIHFIDVEKGSLGSIEVSSASSTKEIQATEGHEQAAVKSDTWSTAQTAVNNALAPYLVPGQKPL